MFVYNFSRHNYIKHKRPTTRMTKFCIFFLLFIIPVTSASYFRKEHIIKAEEIIKLNKNSEFDKSIKIETNEGNTYLITNNNDGVLITDTFTEEYKTESKINLRGYKTVGEVLDGITNLNFITKNSDSVTNNANNANNQRLRRVIEK